MVPPATAASPAPPVKRRRFIRTKAPNKLYHGLNMTLEEFLNWDPEPLDRWKYEWINGMVQSFECRMKPEEKHILDRLNRAFCATKAFRSGGGLLTEVDFVLPGNERVRRPDLAYYTRQQIARCRKERSQVPSFIIEIISQHDNALALERKLNDYFDAGVRCVWLVMPQMDMIKVLAKRHHSDTFPLNTTCSAAPALPEFSIAVSDILADVD